jgi:hypothetical protein
MSLFKLSAATLTLALILQSGCNVFCHREEAGGTAQQSAQHPPCHGTGDGENSEHKQHSGDQDFPEDCAHPQAAEDLSKLLGKIVKENLAAIVVGIPGLDDRFQSEPLTFIPAAIGFHPSSPPSSVLRV